MNFESKDFNFQNNNGTKVIAEIGVNHNGSVTIAKKMIDEAQKRGTDIVKFQAFISEKEISKYADKTPYQKETTSEAENQLEMCKKLELNHSQLKELKNYCDQKKMPFLCAAFDYDSLNFLIDDLKVSTVKIASSEITNIPFLKYIALKKKSVILSTGASTLIETGIAIETLLKNGCDELMVFHCVSSYPAPFDQVNLKAMLSIKNAFNIPVGFSDHTIGNQVAIAAAALGASAIEKHFTLDKNMPGPDHRASIEPDELENLVIGVRIANSCLGDGVKQPALCELENLPLIRKSIVASKNLNKGTIIEENMLELKRPEGGISPADFYKIIGRTLKNNIEEDAPICWEDLS